MSNCLNVVITTIRDLKLAITQSAIDTIVSVSRIGGLSCNTSNAHHDLHICAGIKERLQVTCSILCSIDNQKQYLMWDTGEKILWDNNIEIEFEEWE